MKSKIAYQEITDLATELDLTIQHDCGGYRVVKGNSNLFPNTGICPTATKRECLYFLLGMKAMKADG